MWHLDVYIGQLGTFWSFVLKHKGFTGCTSVMVVATDFDVKPNYKLSVWLTVALWNFFLRGFNVGDIPLLFTRNQIKRIVLDTISNHWTEKKNDFLYCERNIERKMLELLFDGLIYIFHMLFCILRHRSNWKFETNEIRQGLWHYKIRKYYFITVGYFFE